MKGMMNQQQEKKGDSAKGGGNEGEDTKMQVQQQDGTTTATATATTTATTTKAADADNTTGGGGDVVLREGKDRGGGAGAGTNAKDGSGGGAAKDTGDVAKKGGEDGKTPGGKEEVKDEGKEGGQQQEEENENAAAGAEGRKKKETDNKNNADGAQEEGPAHKKAKVAKDSQHMNGSAGGDVKKDPSDPSAAANENEKKGGGAAAATTSEEKAAGNGKKSDDGQAAAGGEGGEGGSHGPAAVANTSGGAGAAKSNPAGGAGGEKQQQPDKKGAGQPGNTGGKNNGNGGNGNGNGGIGKTGDNMGGQKRAEIYTYNSKDMVYALAWSVRKDKKFRLAAGSFVEEYVNKVEILYLDETKGELGLSQPSLSFNHPFPATKIMFLPEKGTGLPDLLATSSDYLRIYKIDDTKDSSSNVEIKSILSNSSNSEFCAPLTSFDWNEDDLNKIGTSSIDTTCTIWDIEKEVVDTQLIAHDREVYDIAWGGAGVFASVSADGSVRVFDLRDKEHSTIIYESPHPEVPLVRLGWNKQDPRYMATILMDSSKVIILDIRFPTLPVAELQRHQASVNALAWAPHSSCHICTAGDDCQALIWDLSSMSQPLDGSLDPILAYHAGAEINNLQWSSAQPDWVAIAFANNVQILRV